MSQQNETTDQKHRCWISDEEKILSFSYVEGFKVKSFDSYQQFMDYCYRKTYQGYLVE